MLVKKNKRKGMILLVIVAFLAMFTVIGTTYLLVADAARKTSEFDIQATDKKTSFNLMADITPDYIFNRFLGQLIYDVQDLQFDINNRIATENSALRGHSLARNMYGTYGSFAFNDRMYWGTGKAPSELPNQTPSVISASDRTINYMSFGSPVISIPGGPGTEISYLFDPGRARRIDAGNFNTQSALISTPNPPYTATDHNHMFLGAYLSPTEYIFQANGTNGSDLITNVPASVIGNLKVGMVIDPSQAYPSQPPSVVEIDKSDTANFRIRLSSPLAGAPPIVPPLDFRVRRFIPSFHRENIFGSMRTYGAISSIPGVGVNYNPNWLPYLPGPGWPSRTPDGAYFLDPNRFKALRPRPFDQLTAAEYNAAVGTYAGPADSTFITAMNTMIANNQLFPYPEADGFDVKNLEGYPGGNDSHWMDVGFPVMTTQDGRKYKVLIAPLILDLDGRVNLNVAGNLMLKQDPSYEYSGNHGSNQGIGRWEINPQKLIANYSYFNSGTIPNDLIAYGQGHPFNPLAITQNPFPSVGPIPVPFNEFLNLLSFKIPSVEPGTNSSDKAASLVGTADARNLHLEKGRFFDPNFIPLVANFPKPDPFRVNTNYFPSTSPDNLNVSGNLPHSYARVDFNASREDENPGGTNYGSPIGGVLGTSARVDFSSLTALGFRNFLPQSYNGSRNLDNLYDETRIKTSSYLAGNFYHSRYFNPYRTIGGLNFGNRASKVFPVGETAALLRWTGKGDLFQSSNLARLLPKSLGLDMPYNTSTANGIFRHSVRNMVTTHSSDLERPAMVPIDVDSAADTSSRFAMIQDYGYPVKVGIGGPKPAPVATPAVPDLPQFAPNRSSPALKLNLNRTLTDYPAYDKNSVGSGEPVAFDLTNGNTQNQYLAALTDRQNFARDIFIYLKDVSGAAKMGSPGDISLFPLASTVLTADANHAVQVNRWLAQLAVNIVDYIDKDDISTQFRWDENDPTRTNAYVFGVEMPRVVINEVFVQAQNVSGATDGTAAPDINTIVELLNPLPADSNYENRPGDHRAILQYEDPAVPGNPTLNYRLVLIRRGATTASTTTLRDEFTRTVTNDPAYYGDLDISPLGVDRLILSRWIAANGFAMVAPEGYKVARSDNNHDNPAGTDPGITVAGEFRSNNLNCSRLDNGNPTSADAPQVVLQRLAVPGLPPQLDPTIAYFNPYITIDVCSNAHMNDARSFDSVGANAGVIPAAMRRSWERRTPFLVQRNNIPINYTSASSDNFDLRPAGNSFGVANSNLPASPNGPPCQVHLDRPLLNVLELLNVPCCFPHEFTQRATRWYSPQTEVIGGVNVEKFPYAANWPWFDEGTRLYRFLEAVAVEPLQNGEVLNGRSLGKINLNTMAHSNVFKALCDGQEADFPSDANNFNDTDLGRLFQGLKSRYISFGQHANRDYGALLPSATTTYTGLQNTILGGLPDTGNNLRPHTSVLDLESYSGVNFGRDGDAQKQIARRELLSKIANSVTTKSNVFAVWMTAGFFEVRDDTCQPPKLGAEIGKADGANIRHRMFAIVDRTHLVANRVNVLPAAPPGYGAFTTTVDQIPAENYYAVENNFSSFIPVTSPAPASVPYIEIRNPVTGGITSLAPGMTLVLDPNTDWEETVQLELVGPGTLGFYVRKEHNPGRRPVLPGIAGRPNAYISRNRILDIISRGNPGPWKGYDYRNDTQVVPYVEFIE